MQSVKTQYDSIAVDALGNLQHVQVHAANFHDTVGAYEILRRAAEKHPSLQAFSGDVGYRGTAAIGVWF